MAAKNVLLLPGMMCDARLWQPQIAALPQNTIVADITTADSIPELAANVLESAPDTFALAGLSMGGIVAFEVWRQASERVTHMALLDTNAGPDAPERQSLRLRQIEQAMAGGLRTLAVEDLKPIYLAPANRDDDVLLDTILQMALDLGPGVFRRQSLALGSRPDSLPTLATIDCPTAVICGRDDELCPVAYHEVIADRIPGASLAVIDNCGHLATLEQPEVVNRELMRLFAR